MSGGHFNYDQYKIRYIADEVEQIVRKNKVEREKKDPWDSHFYYDFPEDVIEKFKEAWYLIRKAEIYAQRIDWLVSGDDGPASFLERLESDLKLLDKENNNKKFEYIPDED